MVGPGCVPLPAASQDSTWPGSEETKSSTRQSCERVGPGCVGLCCAGNRLRPGLWSTMANEGYIWWGLGFIFTLQFMEMR